MHQLLYTQNHIYMTISMHTKHVYTTIIFIEQKTAFLPYIIHQITPKDTSITIQKHLQQTSLHNKHPYTTVSMQITKNNTFSTNITTEQSSPYNKRL